MQWRRIGTDTACEHLDTVIQGHPFEMTEKYNVITIKLMNISLCNFCVMYVKIMGVNNDSSVVHSAITRR